MTEIRTTIYPVRGFHCSGCADDLGESLSRIEGAIKAEADFEAAKVEVRFDPARVSDNDVRAGIRAAGFEPA